MLCRFRSARHHHPDLVSGLLEPCRVTGDGLVKGEEVSELADTLIDVLGNSVGPEFDELIPPNISRSGMRSAVFSQHKS